MVIIRLTILMVMLLLANLTEAQRTVRASLYDSIALLGQKSYPLRDQNPGLARQLGRQALALARQSGDSCLMAKSYLIWGNANNTVSPDSAYLAYKHALQLSDCCDNTSLKANLFHNIGALFSQAGDRHEALVHFDSAIRLGRVSGDTAILGMTLLNYAFFRIEVGDTAEAIKEFTEVASFPLTGGNIPNVAMAIPALIAYTPMPSDEALVLYDSAIRLMAAVPGYTYQLAQLYINKAEILPANEALEALDKALKLSAGYYPLNKLAAWNMMAYAHAELGDLRQAMVILADSAIPLGRSLNENDWLSTIYDSYAEILSMAGRYSEAYTMQRNALACYLAKIEQQKAKQLALLLTMTDLRDKNEKLNQQALLIEVQKSRESKVRLWFSLTLLGLILIFLLWLLWINKQKVKAQQMLTEAASRLVTLGDKFNESLARELHDTSSLLAMNIAGSGTSNFEDIRKNISRLSHTLLIKAEKIGFDFQLKALADTYITFCSSYVRLFIQENLPILREELQLHLLRMVGEMFQNSIKHAEGGTISLQAYENENSLIVVFQDNGTGFDASVNHQGMGMESLRQRAVLIGATLVLKTAPSKGVTWRISVRL